MIRTRDPHFWTFLLVLALGGVAVVNGATLLQFALAQAFAGPDAASLRPFSGNGVAGAAAALDVVRANRSADAKSRERDLTALLSAQPLSGGGWLDLAIARRERGEKAEDVAAALALSSMTGPNEAYLMAGRVSFAMPFWSALPPDARRSLVGDLVGAWPQIDGEARARLAAILQATPEGSGEEVRAALLTNGDAGAEIAKALMPAAPSVQPQAETGD